MARADLLAQLAKAAINNDKSQVLQSLESIIAEEHQKNHRALAERLTSIIRNNGEQKRTGRVLQSGIASLVVELTPDRDFSDIYLSETNRQLLADLKEEHLRGELLQTYGLSPRNRIMLLGAPGNGKTSLAEALAYELMLPLIVVRYEGLIGSFLGETANRLNKIFEYARERHCLLFFDEFDVIGKERGDRNETGEIKRIVSSLLLQIDALPSRTVIVVASNHASLIDSAAWRRFQVRLELKPPTVVAAERYLVDYQKKTKINFGVACRTIIKRLKPISYAELEDFCRDVLRKAVLHKLTTEASSITNQKITEWNSRDQSRNTET